MSTQPFGETNPLIITESINSGTGTLVVSLNDGAEYNWRADHLWVSTDSVTSRVVSFGVKFGGTFSKIGSFLVPAGAGLGGNPVVDLMQEIFGIGNAGFALSGTPGNGFGGLAIKLETALSSGETMDVVLQGGTLD